MSRFAVNQDDRIFRIEGERTCAPSYSIYSNGEGDSIEVTYVLNHRYIESMDCFGLERIYELPISPPNSEECRETGAEPVDSAHWYGNEEEFSCVCTLSKDEFTIIVDPDAEDLMDPCFYHKDGRVEYMYNDFQQLMYIKVVDLTDDEYRFLKGFC